MSRPVETDHNTARYSLTAEDASLQFARANIPRSPRTVMRYCASGHLDCVKIETEKNERYLISPESVARRIQELLSADVSRHDETRSEEPDTQPGRDDALHGNAKPIGEEDLRRENEELKRENFDLKITNRGKDEFIKLVREERAQFVDEIRNQAYRIGELEERLRLPAASAARANETEPGATHATENAAREATQEDVGGNPSNSGRREPDESSGVGSTRSIHRSLFGENGEGSRMDATSSDG